MFYYLAYNLTIQSDVELQGLTEIAPCRQTDIVMQRTKKIPTVDAGAIKFKKLFGLPGKLWIQKKTGCFYIEYGRRVLFDINEADMQCPLHIFLMGSCFGAVLQQRGLIVLHGNTVCSEAKLATTYIGHRGAGKSTTSAWCVKQGSRFVADDITAISLEASKAWVSPGFQRLKLWQDSLRLLELESSSIIYSDKDRAKYHVTISDQQFMHEPVILKKIIELESASEKHGTLLGMDVLERLFEHSYRNQFLLAMGIVGPYMKKLMLLSQLTSIICAPRPVVGEKCVV
ncbi:MAG: hypothetical protein A3F10_07225 [Coxiella sp. RIFCSPHIGHO2_12_FULL_42_15]|nr:MAG: hypothetical protein A3F10_07225 [Coxiella sp. RIFCSPHIGHO2_12_FULL_42_15]